MAASKCDNARGQAGEIGKAKSIDAQILSEVLDAIKAQVMTGGYVAASDFPAVQRPLFWAAITQARDELPNLKPGWRTVREEHLNGLRLRERIYRLRGEG
ncbi:MAG: hypothetical protein JNK97_12325 [Zoogloea sp.]|nr:hypothetical protein [Zoogloea sp.]